MPEAKVEDEQIRAFVDVQGKRAATFSRWRRLLPGELRSSGSSAAVANVDLPVAEVLVMVDMGDSGQRQVVDVQAQSPGGDRRGAEAQIAQVERAVVRLTLLPGDEVEGTLACSWSMPGATWSRSLVRAR